MIIRKKIGEGPKTARADHAGYAYSKQVLVPRQEGRQSCVACYELPPGKSAYPYHYHRANEESFFIVSGTGCLQTPEGTLTVGAGDFLYFPPDESGAHKLTNISETDMLVYIDFDTHNKVDATFYPDSDKVGIFMQGFGEVFRLTDNRDYYDGE